ncbi:hypothetical protein [Nostoc sp.]|uniref:hypothetical protein n=1 Tax=Nostoc sp. TaxID=1180 RepID=UPI002FF4B46F
MLLSPKLPHIISFPALVELGTTAVGDLQVLVIYSDAVNLMIERQPSLGREIGQIVEARSKALSMPQQADVSFNAEVELPIRILK